MTPIDALGDESIRRIFRARQKVNVPGIISHITQRASGAERLFLEDDDYLEMLARLKKVSRTHKLEIMAFVLMPNHLHLLLLQSEANLDQAMRELFSGYARRHNKKYERKGHLFGGRYRQAVCLDEAYVLTVSLYIHLNPVRADLALLSKDYRWSSCRLFTELGIRDSFVSPQRILQILADNPQEARNIYHKMLEEGQKMRMGEVMEDPLAIEGFWWNLSSAFRSLVRFPTPHADAPPKHWDEIELDKRIAGFVEGRIQPWPKDKAAKKYLVNQLISRGFTRKEIARRLGISRKTIYNLVAQQPK